MIEIIERNKKYMQELQTKIVYFDETGDDGNKSTSSDTFILTSLYMPTSSWQKNFDLMRNCRKFLKAKFGFHTAQEMHTKHFLTDKSPYREYSWTNEEKIEILKSFIFCIGQMDVQIVNVIIDKNNITRSDYDILKNALTYNIQRIENSSAGKWNYIIVTDEGRLAPMRKTAREIRAYNPIQSMYDFSYRNEPIKFMIEDIFEKKSSESYFVQICDFVSYFVHLYYKGIICEKEFPNRVGRLIDKDFVSNTINYLKKSGKLNLQANKKNEFGFVIYPKK